MAAPAVTSTLDRLRKAGVVSLIGIGLLVLVGIWLVVNFIQGPDRVHQRRPDRADERHHLRARRARLHAHLRDPAADQLRARRRLRALGARRVVADRQRARPRQADVGRGRDRRDDPDARRDHGPVLDRERGDRVRRLPAAAPRAAPRGADHRGRHVLHHPERLARVLRRQLPLGAVVHPAHGGDRDRRRHLLVEQALGAPDHDPGPDPAHAGSSARRSRGRRCAPSRRTPRRRR